MNEPHVKQFTLIYTSYFPIDEINSYARTNKLRVVAMFPIFGGSVKRQSIVVSFEPWRYEPITESVSTPNKDKDK